jgi:hypothetical protein
MSARNITTALAVAACAATALVPAAQAASSAGVGPQKVQHGGTFPVTVAGQHPAVRAGQHLRSGQILLSRHVTLKHGGRAQFLMTCPQGKFNRGMAPGTGEQIDFLVTHVRHYVGFRDVAMTAVSRVHPGKTGHGTVYAICS